MKKIYIVLCIILQITFVGCTAEQVESSFLSDLDEAGFSIAEGINLGESSYEDQLLHYNFLFNSFGVTFGNIYTFEDESSIDYGYIYEIMDVTIISTFFENRIDYSRIEDNIIFVYLVDQYVLEVYHDTNSTFPGFLRHYEFEASYQYYMFYTDELAYPPIISTLIEDGATVTKIYTETELLENSFSFSDYNIPYRKAYQIIDENIGAILLVIEVNNIEEAILVYENQADRIFPASAVSQMVVRYQNLVFRIAYPHYSQTEVLSAIMGDVVYEMYDEEDIINSLN